MLGKPEMDSQAPEDPFLDLLNTGKTHGCLHRSRTKVQFTSPKLDKNKTKFTNRLRIFLRPNFSHNPEENIPMVSNNIILVANWQIDYLPKNSSPNKSIVSFGSYVICLQS